MYKRFETLDSLVKGGVCSVKYTDFTCTWYVTCYYVNMLVSCYMKNSVAYEVTYIAYERNQSFIR